MPDQLPSMEIHLLMVILLKSRHFCSELICGCPERTIRKVSIAFGGHWIGVAQQPADDFQTEPA